MKFLFARLFTEFVSNIYIVEVGFLWLTGWLASSNPKEPLAASQLKPSRPSPKRDSSSSLSFLSLRPPCQTRNLFLFLRIGNLGLRLLVRTKEHWEVSFLQRGIKIGRVMDFELGCGCGYRWDTLWFWEGYRSNVFWCIRKWKETKKVRDIP